jgi:hypothetical protein
LLQHVDDRCEEGLQTTWAWEKRRRPSVAAAVQKGWDYSVSAAFALVFFPKLSS